MRVRTSGAVAALAVLLVACAPEPSPAPSGSAGPGSSGASSPSGSVAASPTASVTAWTQLQVSGSAPTAREDHTWTITPDGVTAYLFGGRDRAILRDDLWAYSLATDTWSLLAPSGVRPSARFGHNAAWVEGVGLVIFAGQAGADFFNDLWAYDPASNEWRSLRASGTVPVPRYGSCAAVGADGRLWISHGFTSEGQRFADTRAYDFATGAWTDETPAGDAPIPRCLHACWWTDDGRLILYAGQTTGVTALGDRWRLTVGERPGTNTWSQLQPSGELPADRNLYAAARWGSGTLVFGGQGLDGAYLADTWWLADEATTMLLNAGKPSPPARAGAELIADSGRARLLLFGGRDGEQAFGDLWQLAVPRSP